MGVKVILLTVGVLVISEVVLTIIEGGNDDKLGLCDEGLGVKIVLGVGNASVLDHTVISGDEVVSDGRIITIVVEVSDGIKVSGSNVNNGTTVGCLIS